MSERTGNAGRTESDPYGRPEVDILAPDDAYFPTEKVIGALNAAESARTWLKEHPESSLGAAPPEGEDKPTSTTSQEELDQLLADVQALAQPSTHLSDQFKLAA